MATTNKVELMPVTVQVTDGVPGALANRFVVFETSSPGEREVKTLVPSSANGGYPDGILAEDVILTAGDGFFSSSMAVPDGSYPKVLLGENVTAGAALRVGGLSAEVDGAAYLADATGNIIVAKAMEAGNAGEIIQISFVSGRGLAA